LEGSAGEGGGGGVWGGRTSGIFSPLKKGCRVKKALLSLNKKRKKNRGDAISGT